MAAAEPVVFLRRWPERHSRSRPQRPWARTENQLGARRRLQAPGGRPGRRVGIGIGIGHGQGLGELRRKGVLRLKLRHFGEPRSGGFVVALNQVVVGDEELDGRVAVLLDGGLDRPELVCIGIDVRIEARLWSPSSSGADERAA